MAKLDLGKVVGDDGYSPTVETSKSGKVTTITITDVNGTHTATILDGEDGSAASGDMKKEVYDTNNNGIVDNAEKVNNHTVEKDVPANAVFTDTTYSAATTEANGLMSSTDKTKLNGIASGAEVNVQANWSESNSSSDAYIKNKPTIPDELADLSDDSTHRLVTDTEKSAWNNKSDEVIQYSTMPTANSTTLGKVVQYVGTSISNSYTHGYYYECVSDGASTPTYSWENINVQAGGGGTAYTAGDNITISNNVISATDTTYSNATTETAGLMSTDDKTKLNGIASGAEVNVQANWNESDTSSDAYIQNKPTIPEAVQYSTMPTASADNLGDIVQYTGASVANSYTNGYFYKCVSDGQSTPTYSWENIDVQAGGGGTTYTAGTNMSINSNNVISCDIPYTRDTTNNNFKLGEDITANGNMSVSYGKYITVGTKGVAMGWGPKVGNNSVAVGGDAEATYAYSIALGLGAKTTKSYQMMIGSSTGNITEVAMYTNNGAKVMATQDYVASNYLARANTSAFTPTGDYNPATKKYVDDALSNIDLSNYLAKDNTTSYTPTGDYNPATKLYVDSVFSSLASFEFEQVATLPSTDISTTTIYLQGSSNPYNMYIYADNTWVLIGTTQINLDPQVTTDLSSTSYTIASLGGHSVYKLGTLTDLTISAVTTFDTETVIYFASGSTPTDISLPASITNLGDAPTMTETSGVNTGTCAASKSYIISVLNNIAVWRAY